MEIINYDVLIPARNEENNIKKTLESINNQTIKPRRKFSEITLCCEPYQPISSLCLITSQVNIRIKWLSK